MALEVIVGILGLVGAGFFFWAGFKARNQAQATTMGGVEGEGMIVSRRTSGTYRDRTFYVTFDFEAARSDGEKLTYTHEEEVKGDHYRSLPEQSKVTIRYLPDDPAASARLSGMFKDTTESVSPFAYGTGCLIGALLIIGIALNVGAEDSPQTSLVATYMATASGDLSVVQAAIQSQLTQWEEVEDQDAHFISSASVGLSNVTQEQIVYGYCPDKTFYVYVPKGFQEGNAPNIHASDAYTFYSASDDFCWPSGWIATKKGDLGDGWSLSTVVRMDPTGTPGSTEESIPTEPTSG